VDLEELPEWFQELNQDFRYQLTAIGSPAPQLHIAEEVSENRFRIAGGEARIKVSWQVTGVRKDRWAQANPIEVEEEKTEEEQGRYLHPELYDEPEERGIHWLMTHEEERGYLHPGPRATVVVAANHLLRRLPCCLYSPNCRQKLSEKSRMRLQRSLTGH